MSIKNLIIAMKLDVGILPYPLALPYCSKTLYFTSRVDVR